MSTLRRRTGRRGVALIVLGVGKICWGIGYVAAPTTNTSGLSFLTRLLPLEGWAAVWAGCGAVVLVSAFLPEGPDRWGWVAAVVPPTTWALGYAWGAVGEGYARGWFIAGWYLTSHIAFIWWAASVAEYRAPPLRGRLRSRRSMPLRVLGVGQVCWGVGYVAAPATDTAGLGLVLGLAPMSMWACVWVAVGIFTFTASALPEGPDRWGFAGAVLLPLLWALSYAVAWVGGDYRQGVYLAVWYLCSHVLMALWAAWVPECQLPQDNDEGEAA